MAGAIPTIAEAARQIAAKELSPVELTQACLDRVHKLDNELHAFIHLTEERALAEARAAETLIMARGPSGPLHGIPIGLKDIVDTKGIPTTCESKLLQDNIPDADADLRRQARRRRHGPDRQIDDARIRRWRPQLRPALAAGAQSVEHRAFHRRQQQRHRRRQSPPG